MNALTSPDSNRVAEMKETIKQFQIFLVDFEVQFLYLPFYFLYSIIFIVYNKTS